MKSLLTVSMLLLSNLSFANASSNSYELSIYPGSTIEIPGSEYSVSCKPSQSRQPITFCRCNSRLLIIELVIVDGDKTNTHMLRYGYSDRECTGAELEKLFPVCKQTR